NELAMAAVEHLREIEIGVKSLHRFLRNLEARVEAILCHRVDEIHDVLDEIVLAGLTGLRERRALDDDGAERTCAGGLAEWPAGGRVGLLDRLSTFALAEHGPPAAVVPPSWREALTILERGF